MDFDDLTRKYAGRRHMQSLPSITEESMPPIARTTIAPRVRDVLAAAQQHLRALGYEPNVFEYSASAVLSPSSRLAHADMLMFSLSWKVMDPAGGHLRSGLVICVADKPENAIVILSDGPGTEAEVVTGNGDVEPAELTDLIAGAIDTMLSREDRVANAQAEGLPITRTHVTRP